MKLNKKEIKEAVLRELELESLSFEDLLEILFETEFNAIVHEMIEEGQVNLDLRWRLKKVKKEG